MKSASTPDLRPPTLDLDLDPDSEVITVAVIIVSVASWDVSPTAQ